MKGGNKDEVSCVVCGSVGRVRTLNRGDRGSSPTPGHHEVHK